MASGFVIRKNQYYDSLFLMGINKQLSDNAGVQQTAVLMGSPVNKKLLYDIGIQGPEIGAAAPNDLIVAVVADTSGTVSGVLGRLDEYLVGIAEKEPVSNLHTLQDGLAQRSNASLAVISVPGEYAGQEARKALEAGLNVFLFSDNVSLEQELELKNLAAQKRLLVMGPDCGTSLINGVGIGFANAVRKGEIGVIGAAGTGLQEFTSQIHNAGAGISHAIGTGSHDLTDKIGGLTTFAALNALEADPQTKLIAVISKPPGGETLDRLIKQFAACKKPVIGCFLGTPAQPQAGASVFQRAGTIDEAVLAALKTAGHPSAGAQEAFSPQELDTLRRERASRTGEQKYLRGLFAGGTFCYQSQQILRDAGIPVYSNAPLNVKYELADADRSQEHSLVDMGDDHFTLGKPHPMIDGTLRKQRILKEGRDPQVAILLLDFILGYNASQDPAGELLDAILEAKQAAVKRGGALTVAASICGTDGDPQDLRLQSRLLREAGVFVFHSNARAANFCCELLRS